MPNDFVCFYIAFVCRPSVDTQVQPDPSSAATAYPQPSPQHRGPTLNPMQRRRLAEEKESREAAGEDLGAGALGSTSPAGQQNSKVCVPLGRLRFNLMQHLAKPAILMNCRKISLQHQVAGT